MSEEKDNKDFRNESRKTKFGEIKAEIIDLRYNKGYSTGSLVKFLMDKYDYANSRAYQLIREARKEVGEYHDKTNENILEDVLEKLERMYMAAIESDNGRLALEVQKEINKVIEIYKNDINIDSERINININMNKDKEDKDGE